MYSLIAIFFAIPLYFSHVFSPFGVIIWNSGSFERQKVYLFAMLIVMAIVELGMRRWKDLFPIIEKYWYGILFVLCVPYFSTYYWDAPFGEHFFLWSFEKHHGYIWYILFIILSILIASLSSRERYTLIRTTVFAGSIVAFFSVLEFLLGWSVFISSVFSPIWWDVRSVSTLWNANYVAGYLLICIPLLYTLQSPGRWFYGILLLLGLLATQSYIGVCLLALYVLYKICRELFSPQIALLCTLGIGALSLYTASGFIDPEKLLSLESRFVLMRELWTVMVQYPFSFLVWFGPESIITYFEGTRSLVINDYFPQTSPIDSSHNIFLDFLFYYGILPLIGTVYLIYQSWWKLTQFWREWFVLGLLFLSLNVVITSHIIVLILLVSFTKVIKQSK